MAASTRATLGRRPGLAGVLIAALALAAAPAWAEPIRGAGSTFAAPLIAAWSRAYTEARVDGGDYVSPDWKVDYEPIGSLGGVLRLAQPEMDFAATDRPLSVTEVEARGVEQFPFVIGGIAIVATLPGLGAGELRLTGALLADIYTGRLLTWSAPEIVAANPGLALPETPITVLHRQDGSGSTFAFTEYLSAGSPEWRARYGADTLITWPRGRGAEGTRALIAALRETPGAIAYVEAGQALRAGLAPAAIANRAGAFVLPSPAGFAAAVAGAPWSAETHYAVSLIDSAAAAAYPITTATWAVVPVANRAEGRIARVRALFRLGLEAGGAEAERLGYLALPPDLARRIVAGWSLGG